MKNKRTSIKRAISSIKQQLNSGNVAFYLGAGVDKLLSINSENKIQSQSWEELLSLLISNNFANSSNINEYKNLILQWPAEMGSLIRTIIGDKKFSNEIHFKTNNNNFSPDFSKTDINLLCQLLSFSNIIVTTNYSDYISKTLNEYYSKNKNLKKRKIIIIDREDLSGFLLPPPKIYEDISITYIIHIHGRSSLKSFPILDAWGYNTIQNQNSNYQIFLQELFKQRNIITIGSSWSDIPIKNISSFIKSEYEYLNKSNLSIYFDDKLARNKNSTINWTNSMKAIYDFNFEIVDKNTQTILFQNLLRPIPYPTNNENYHEISTFLDATGDYESLLQIEWLNNSIINTKEIKISNIEKSIDNIVKNIYYKLEQNTLNITDWIDLAIIERHLRHHIWFYPPKNKNPNKIRIELWNKLHEKLKNNFFKEISNIPEEILFHFLIGKYEFNIKENTIEFEFQNNKYKKRYLIASNLWRKPNINDSSSIIEYNNEILFYEETAKQLINLGWESMAAKVLTDKCFLLAKAINHEFPNKFTENNKLSTSYNDSNNHFEINLQTLNSDTKRAERIARSTGYTRRRIKSDVLNSIWNTNPYKARNNLLSILLESNFHFEPMLKKAIGIGFVVNSINILNIKQERKTIKELDNYIQKMLVEVGLNPEYILEKRNINYWKEITPNRLQKEYKKIIELYGS